MEKTSCENHCSVLRHGRTCSNWRKRRQSNCTQFPVLKPGGVSAMSKPKSMNLVMAQNKTCQFGTSKRVEYEEKLTARIERFHLPCECSNRTGQCFDRLLKTEARHSPKSSRALSSEETGKYSKCGVLAAGKEGRIFTLNRRLETNARCGFTHEKVRNRVS